MQFCLLCKKKFDKCLTFCSTFALDVSHVWHATSRCLLSSLYRRSSRSKFKRTCLKVDYSQKSDACKLERRRESRDSSSSDSTLRNSSVLKNRRGSAFHYHRSTIHTNASNNWQVHKIQNSLVVCRVWKVAMNSLWKCTIVYNSVR